MNSKKISILNPKGISSVVATVIIATISVALVGTTYFFSKGMIESATAETFELIDMFGNKIIIKNAGTQLIAYLKTYLDGNEIGNTIEYEGTNEIPAGKVGSVNLDLYGVQSGIHQLTIVSKSMSQTFRWQFTLVTTTISGESTTSTITATSTSTTTTEEIGGQSIEISVKSQQGAAEIGKPVKWTSKIDINNPSSVDISDYVVNLTIPKDAQNVVIKDSTEQILTMNEKSVTVNVTEKTYASYSAEYETPAPYKEEVNESKDWEKIIKVKSDATVHYMNVSVNSEISENVVPKIYLIQEDMKIDITDNSSYNVSLIDSNLNGRIDTISWMIPELSEKLFGILDVGSWLNVTLLTPSPSLCNETYPCSWLQNSNQWVNATVECKNAACGIVSGSVKYNDSATTWKLVSAQSGTQPFYLTSGGPGGGQTINPDKTWYNITGATFNLAPHAAIGPCLVFDPKYQKTILFGGVGKLPSTGISKQTWILNHTDNEWYNATRNDNGPPALGHLSPQCIYDDRLGAILLYGGWDGSARVDNLWMYNTTNNTWSLIDVAGQPGIRGYFGIAYDTRIKNMIMFGGTSDGVNFFQDTWLYNSTDWKWYSIATPTIVPTKREQMAMTYDEGCKLTVMFGGLIGSKYANDTWVFNSSDNKWYDVSNNNRAGGLQPSNRTDARLAYSASLNKTVLYGGAATSSLYMRDTWVWNCTDYKWYNVTGSLGGIIPPLKTMHGFVYNNFTTNFVLFGGRYDALTYAKNDTYLLNYTWGGTVGGGGVANIQSCGNLNIGQKCQLNWTLKITDSSESPYKINVNFSTADKYAQNDTSNAIIKTELPDITAPAWYDNSTNNTQADMPTKFSLRWTDNKGLSGYIFSLDNCTGVFSNATEGWQSMSGLNAWSNVTKFINSTVNCPIRWMFYANDTSNNWNDSDIFSFNTIDLTPPKWYNNSTNSTAAGEPAEFRLNWNDNGGLSGYIFSLDNCTGVFSNATEGWQSMSGLNAWSNVTKFINSTVNCPIRWMFYANDTSNNWNDSDIFSFNTTISPGWFNVTLIEPSPKICNATYPCERNGQQIFWVNSTMECKKRDCGAIYGTVRYNSSVYPDTTISKIKGTVPFYVVDYNETILPTMAKNSTADETARINVSDNSYAHENCSGISSCSSPPIFINFTTPSKYDFLTIDGYATYGTNGGGSLQCYNGSSWISLIDLQPYETNLTTDISSCSNSNGNYTFKSYCSDVGGNANCDIYLNFVYLNKSINPKYCGHLSRDQSCNLNWIVNTTGGFDTNKSIDVNFTSDLNLWNDTNDTYIKIVDKEPPQYYDNVTNNTVAGYLTEFSTRWTDDNSLDSYRFYLDNCTGVFKKMNESKFKNGGMEDWSKELYVINSTTGCIIRWRFEANDTKNNTNYGFNNSFKVAFIVMPVELIVPNPSECTDANPCKKEQYKNYNVIANVTCKLVPPDYGNCGRIFGYLRYNNSGPYPDTPITPAPSIPLGYASHFTSILLPMDINNTAYKIDNDLLYYPYPDPIMNSFTDSDYSKINVSDNQRVSVYADTLGSCAGSLKCSGLDQGSCSLCTCTWQTSPPSCKFPAQDPCNTYLTQADCTQHSVCSCSWNIPSKYAHFKFTFNLSSFDINSIENITYYFQGYNAGPAGQAYLQFKNSTGWFRDDLNTLTGVENTYKRTFTDVTNMIENGLFTFGVTGMINTESSMTVYANYVNLTVKYNASNPADCGILNKGDTCQLSWLVNATGGVDTALKLDVNFTSEPYKTPPNNAYNDTRDAVIKIKEGIPPNYWNNSTNSTSAGYWVQFRLNWTDNSGLSGYIFSLDNCTGKFNNDTWQPMSGKTAWSNVSKVVNSTLGCIVRWRVYANDTSDNWNASIPFQFYTTNQPPAIPTIMNPVKGQWFNKNTVNPYIFSCNSTDADTDPITYNISWCEQLTSCSYKIICSADSDGNCGDNYDWRSNMPDDDNITIRCEAYDGKAMSSFGYTWFKKDVTDPTCILNITDGAILILNYRINGTYLDTFNVSNVTYFYYNESTKIWNLTGINSTYPDFTWGWNVPSILEDKINVTLRAVCNDTAGNSANDTRMGVIVDTINQNPRIWNLWIRDDYDFIMTETGTGVNVYFTVNATDPDPYRNISYIQGNFTLPNGTSIYKNFTMSPLGKPYTHNWTYVIPYNTKYSPPNGTINVTAYDYDRAWNTTNRSLWIRKTVFFDLYNAPINFSLVYPRQKVDALPGQGWPLYAQIEGNVKMNLTQKAKEDLIGMIIQNEKIGIRNVTWNVNTTGPFSQLVATDYLIINRSVGPGYDQPIYYKLDVPSIMPQRYGGQVDIYGNCSKDVSCQEEYP